MTQNPKNCDSLVEEAKRLELFGYSFSAISFLIFVYVLLFPILSKLSEVIKRKY